MKTHFIAAAVLALSMGAAHAGEGRGNPFPNDLARPVVANAVLDDTGSQGLPHFGQAEAALSQGNLVALNGNSQGEVQTANSLPAGAAEGTVAYTQAQSVQRALAVAATSTQVAARATRLN